MDIKTEASPGGGQKESRRPFPKLEKFAKNG